VFVAVVALLAVPVAVFAGHQSNSVQEYTGCIKKNGEVYNLQVGTAPRTDCKSDEVLFHIAGGDITEVLTDTGLVGGGNNGALTLSLAPSYRLPQGCVDTAVAKWDNDSSSWACGDDQTGASGPASDVDCDGCVDSDDLANGAVNTDNLHDDAVNSAKIADNTIVTGDLGAGAVTTGKMTANAASGFGSGPPLAIAPGTSTTTSAVFAFLQPGGSSGSRVLLSGQVQVQLCPTGCDGPHTADVTWALFDGDVQVSATYRDTLTDLEPYVVAPISIIADATGGGVTHVYRIDVTVVQTDLGASTDFAVTGAVLNAVDLGQQ